MSKAHSLSFGAALGALVLPLIGCGSPAHEPDETYYLVTVNTKIPYWQAAAAGLAHAASSIKVLSETLGPDTYDPQAERDAFRKAAGKNPSGILVSAADPELLRPEIDAAIARGIPVITVDADSPSSKRLLFIGTDNYEAGRRGGAIVARELNGKGDVVVFTMPEQTNLAARLHGYEEVFKAHPGIRITEVIDVKGDPRIAFDRTMDYLDKKRPVDAFVCLEAQSCPEVAEVLSRKQAKKVVVGMDTDPRTLEWIQKGMIAATIAQKPYTMAYFGLKTLDMIHHSKPKSLLVDWAADTRSPLPSLVDTGATLIDKSNVDAFLKENPGLREPPPQ
jgi:ribose transport system substrate-binding protein